MRIELIFIGEELLRGAVVNTNAAYLGFQFSTLGWKVSQQTIIPDIPEIIKECVGDALKRADLILMTGGLGPTLDDCTRKALATLFDTELVRSEEVFADLKARYGNRAISLEDQATIPRLAKALFNPVGTAPGLLLEKEERLLVALPGVPIEMRTLFEEKVRPYLLKRYKERRTFLADSLSFFAVTESEMDLVIRKVHARYPEVEFGIYPREGTLTINLIANHAQPLEEVKQELIRAFPQHQFSSVNGKLEEAIHAWMIAHHKTLALAESCTGGRIAAQLTALAGSSQYFLGAFVPYSNRLKERVLGVSKQTLIEHGAVSEEVVEEMLLSLFRLTEAEYGLAITGLAGPDIKDEKLPVGTLYIAVGARGQNPRIESYCFSGNREKIQLLAVNYALGALYREIN